MNWKKKYERDWGRLGLKSDWNNTALADLVSLVIDYRGKTPKKLGSDWVTHGYRALSARNIKKGQIVQPESIKFADSDLYQRWMKNEIQRNDILITSEAPFGEAYLWNSDEKIVLSQRLFALRCKKEYYAPFIYYYMSTMHFQGELRGRATGTTVTGLRQPELLKCEIWHPDYDQQQIIADTLSVLDSKINENTKINHHLPPSRSATDISPDIRRGKRESRMSARWRFSASRSSCMSNMGVHSS